MAEALGGIERPHQWRQHPAGTTRARPLSPLHAGNSQARPCNAEDDERAQSEAPGGETPPESLVLVVLRGRRGRDG